MLSRLITASFHKPLVAIALALAGAALGAVWMRDLPRDVFPDLSAPVFNVIVQNPAMNADELEMRVAIPFETALSGLPGVRRVRSSSTLGVVQVTMEFEPDADDPRSRQYVAERLGQVELPPGTEAPLLSGVTGRLNEIYEITIEARPGVADLDDAARSGGVTRSATVCSRCPGSPRSSGSAATSAQFQVHMDPDRMSARGVTLDDVLHAARAPMSMRRADSSMQAPMEWTVRAVGRARTVGRAARDRRRRRRAARRCSSATSRTCARRRRSAAGSRTACMARW